MMPPKPMTKIIIESIKPKLKTVLWAPSTSTIMFDIRNK